jgi:hypothetical protein
MPEAELNNLARIGQLDKVPVSADLLRKMLATARTRLQDAQRTDNSTETRFDCAYTAIRAVADAALLAHGWRTATSKPGHHQTTIGCLVHTLGVSSATVRVLDALRKRQPSSTSPSSSCSCLRIKTPSSPRGMCACCYQI